MYKQISIVQKTDQRWYLVDKQAKKEWSESFLTYEDALECLKSLFLLVF